MFQARLFSGDRSATFHQDQHQYYSLNMLIHMPHATVRPSETSHWGYITDRRRCTDPITAYKSIISLNG